MMTSPLLRCITWTGGTAAALLAASWGAMLVVGALAAPVFIPTGLPPARDDVPLLCVIGPTGLLLTMFTVGRVAFGAVGYWRSWAFPRQPRLAWPALALAAALAVTAAGILQSVS